MLNKKRIIIVVIILLLLIAGIVFWAKKFSKEKIDIGYRSNVNMVDIMAEKGIVGEDDLYVVAEEYDGRKSVTIKPSYLFEVAFLGIFQANRKRIPEPRGRYRDRHREYIQKAFSEHQAARRPCVRFLRTRRKSRRMDCTDR